MGFTIDMVTGNISDITNDRNSLAIEETSLSPSPTDKSDGFEPFVQERLLPVVDTYSIPDAYVIPGSLIDCDIDSFMEDM